MGGGTSAPRVSQLGCSLRYRRHNPGATAHAGARRPARGRGGGLLGSCSQPNSNQNTKGDTKKDVVKRKAKAHANGNTHADGRLTSVAVGQVGPPIQSSTHHNAVGVDADPTTGWQGFNTAHASTLRQPAT